MIIAINNAEKEQVKRAATVLADNLNHHLEKYAQTGLTEIKGGTLNPFASDPVGYFNDRVTELAKEKGMVGVDPVRFGELYKISFSPDLKRYPVDARYLKFVKLEKGKVIVVPGIDSLLKDVGITEVKDPEEEKAAEALLRLFAEFTYVSTLLANGGSGELIRSAGSNFIGFSPMHLGHLTSDTVKRLSDAMKVMPREKFTKLLVEQTGNPAYTTL
jgi:hypothetical protein